jgi:hypothetical protein
VVSANNSGFVGDPMRLLRQIKIDSSEYSIMKIMNVSAKTGNSQAYYYTPRGG